MQNTKKTAKSAKKEAVGRPIGHNNRSELERVMFSEEKTGLIVPQGDRQTIAASVFQQLLQNPLVKSTVSEIIPLIHRPLLKVMRECHNQEQILSETLLKTLYLVQSDVLEEAPSSTVISDPIVQKALLDRVIYAVNLEVILHLNLQKIMAYCTKAYSVFIEDQLLKDLSLLGRMVSDMMTELLFIYDYLPMNKGSLLLVHPDSLWNKDHYDAYQEDITEEKIRERLLFSLPFLKAYPQLPDMISLIQNLRHEMKQIYDLLALQDKDLIRYCADMGFSDEALYAAHQSAVLAFLNASEKQLLATNHPLKDKVNLAIDAKKSMICQNPTWLRFENREAYKSFFIAQSVTHQSFGHLDPKKMVALFLGELDIVLACKIFAEHVKSAKTVSILKFIGMSQRKAEEFRLLIDNKIGLFLALLVSTKLSIFELEQIIEVYFPFLDRISSFQDASAYVRNALAGILGSPSRVLKFISSLEKEKDEFFADSIREGKFTKKTAFIAVEKDPSLFLLKAIETRAAAFLTTYLNAMHKKASLEPSHFDVAPVTQAEQEKILKAGLVWLKEDTANEGAKEILSKLLASSSSWKVRLIKNLLDSETHSDSRSVLSDYLEKMRQPRGKTLSLSADTDRTPDTFEAKSCSSSSASSADTSPNPNPISLSCSSTFFACVSPSVIDTKELAEMIRYFSTDIPTSMKNAQCYALTLLTLRFFQAYHIMPKATMPGLTIEMARNVRNALVHQHLDQSSFDRIGFVFDGKGQEFLDFIEALVEVLQSNDARPLLPNPLFHLLTQHGEVLSDNHSRGHDEYIKFRQRMKYGHWLGKSFQSFQKLQNETKEPKFVDMLECAKTLLYIFDRMYCLREAACQPNAAEAALAMSLRHSQAILRIHLQEASKETAELKL